MYEFMSTYRYADKYVLPRRVASDVVIAALRSVFEPLIAESVEVAASTAESNAFAKVVKGAGA